MPAKPIPGPADDAAIIEARDLRRYYHISRGFMRGHAELHALDGVSFRLRRGKTIAVVGESGCGKSTLARQVTLIEKPTSGSLQLDGHDLANATTVQLKAMRKAVQMIFQNPFGSLNPRKKIGTIIEEPLIINTGLTAPEREAAARDMMQRVGLRPEHYDRYPHMFSGGQRQRIAIARALMLNPRVVVADEPVSALDVSIQAQVLNLMLDLQQELGVAYVFISHDLSVVQHIADEVMVMYLGRPVEQGANATIFSQPVHPYTRALLGSTPRLEAKSRRRRIVLAGELPSPLDPPSGCAFRTRCPYAIDRCAAEAPAHRLVNDRHVACHRAEEIDQLAAA